MNPQKLSQLDPKLREAYQRVMRTSVPQTPAIQTQAAPPAASDVAATDMPTGPIQYPAPQVPLSEPTHPPFDLSQTKWPDEHRSEKASAFFSSANQEKTLKQTQPLAESPAPVTEPQIISTNISMPQEPLRQNSFDRIHSEVAPAPQVKEIPLKKKRSFMPFLIGVIVLILIVAYTFFWTKIFNFQLPFLP